MLPPVNGWKKALVATDLSTAADVCRAKDIRNQLKHTTVATLAVTNNYNYSILTKVKDILYRLGYKDMPLFYDLKTGNSTKFIPQMIKVLDGKFNSINDNVNDIINKVDNLELDLTVDNQLKQLCKEVVNIKHLINAIEKKVGDIDKDLECKINSTNSTIDDMIKKIDENTARSKMNEKTSEKSKK